MGRKAEPQGAESGHIEKKPPRGTLPNPIHPFSKNREQDTVPKTGFFRRD
jgi:hypothetical protein